jgi:predicted 3-demethylubiquinone-9 3-methyltransferase (glyoxalase superfamily)
MNSSDMSAQGGSTSGGQKIVPHLWFDKEAKEAANLYASIFGGDSKVMNVRTITGTPSGDCDIVSFKLWGYEFMSISAGPYFKPTPAISFMVNFDPAQDNEAAKKIDEIWAKLSEGGEVMMELGEYPFSKRYGWCADKYGFSWQLILTDPKGEPRPSIIPSLLYVTDTCETAEAATDFYLKVFKDSKRGTMARYPAGMEPNKEGGIMFTDFMLEGQWFAAMDGSSQMHKFDFNEAISFVVNCEDQAEVDYYWEKLSAVPEAEQCGWLKDKFGVSWQIVPIAMNDMMASGDQAKIDRVTQAFLRMKKFNIAELEAAAEGK